jgi:hypothetical protein
MRHAGGIGLAVLLFGAFWGCSYVVPHASIGDFSDQVLEPAAARLADEKILEIQALMKAEQAPTVPLQTLASLLQELPWVGRLMNVGAASQKARLEQDLLWLETRRVPLRRELLTLFESRVEQSQDTFSFCISGVQRRYQATEGGRFSRLPDGSVPCETTALHTLQRDASK